MNKSNIIKFPFSNKLVSNDYKKDVKKVEGKSNIVNTIKLFMVYGAKDFYLNYLTDGEDFIEKSFIDNRYVETVLKTKTEEAEEPIEELIRRTWLTHVIEFEKNPITDVDELRLFKYIADSIKGNMCCMFEMLSQIVEFGEIDEALIDEAEANVYHGIGKMICYCGKLDGTFN